ncbi:MAG TPA: CHC2 zinc finger domain-containing protein [Terriglobia bacterium]|nr:CHC2 zinc finger domain-containing protein [Terriglobia bacterium]
MSIPRATAPDSASRPDAHRADARRARSQGIDTQALRQAASLVAVIGARVKLARRGSEWIGLCPFHAERTPSFSVNEAKGFYHCFGCGAHGDVIRFVADFHGLDFRAACAVLGAADATVPVNRDGRAAPGHLAPYAGDPHIDDPYAGLVPADPPLDTTGAELRAGAELRCWNPRNPTRPWVTYRPSALYPYRRADGSLIGYVLRIDLPARDGPGSADAPRRRKITPAIRYALLPPTAAQAGREAAPAAAWCHWSFDKPRPLYRLPDLAAQPRHQVLVVEGEKAAEAAQRLVGPLPIVVTTWPGGAKAMHHADWSPLAGRIVLLWGDADAAGEGAMLGQEARDGKQAAGVAQLCHAAGARQIRYLPWDRSRPRGWDAADAESEGWGTADLLACLTANLRDWQAEAAPETAAAETRAREASAAEGPERPVRTAQPAGDMAPPFRVLGHHRGSYFYLSLATRQVVALSPAAHSRPHLLTLAPLAYWSAHYPGRNGFDLEAASDALITAAHRAGLFTPDRLRGRGAWRDRNRVVMHTGRHLYVDGQPQAPGYLGGDPRGDQGSDYIYEAAPDLGVQMGGVQIGGTTDAGMDAGVPPPLPPAAGTAEANRLVQVCRRLTWENDLSGDLLAGWCVIALLCGVLDWRPHLWITGPAQAGKSTVIKEIIRRVVGVFALYVDGKTTEAGIRQLLGADARPVILDELESEDTAAALRVQQILDMARVSSSGGTVVKGSTGGKPLTYTLRACICFSSINTAVAHYADETRISKLVLRRNEAPDADRQYRDLMRDIDAWFTPDYAARLLSRSLTHLDVLLANARTFTHAAARVLQSRRAADQIGTMLAGLFLCHSDAAISVDDAEAWIKARDWHDHTAIGAAGDEARLLERLATRRLKVPVAGGQREVTIGQAILAVHDQPETYGDWAAELGAHGIRIDGADMLIANNASPLKRLLEGTPWAADWLRPLRMRPGASAAPNTYFSPGLKSRATRLPVSLLGMEG